MGPLLLPRRRGVWKPLVGVGLVVAAALSVTPMLAQRLTSSPLSIHVAGNHLVDGAGATVTLHGVDLSGTEFACDESGGPTNRGWSIYGGQPLDQLSTYQAMASWNVDVVRVPLNEDCWLGLNGVNPAYGGANYQAAIATEVSLINQSGMIAILDLHWSAPGAWAAIAQQPMADADHSIAFWQSVATYFKGDPSVIFDLFNEPFLYSSYFTNPNQDPWQCWLDGCSLNQFVSGDQVGPNGQTTGYTTPYTWQTAGMQQLIDAIRTAGATQPILVNGVDWANDDSGWLSHAPQDPLGQIIAGAHDYPGETCDTTACWDSQQAPISARYPFLVGETGDHTTAPVAFLPTFLPYADSHGWSYLAWTWNPWTYTDDVLITSWNGTPNAGEGTYYRQHLLSLPSNPLPTSAPSATSTPATVPSSTPSAAPPPTGQPSPGPGGLPVNRAVGINLPGGHAGDQTPISAIPGEIQDAAQNLHVSWVRHGFDWWRIDPNQCTQAWCYEWSETDPVMAAAAKYGVGVDAIIGSPHWTSSTPTYPSASFWTAFVTAFVQRYDSLWKPEGLRGLVIEPWNEPDQSTNWTGTPAQWATQIQLPAYQAAKKVDPSVLVTFDTSDWSTGGHAFWQGVVAAIPRGTPFVDLPGYHDYANSAQAWAASFRSFLAANGVKYVAVWCTEFGAGITPPVSEPDQVHINVLQSQIPPTLAGSGGPDAMFYYAYKDLAEGGVVHESYGLMDINDNHYASYAVFQRLMAAAPAPAPSITASPAPSTSPTSTPTPSWEPSPGDAPTPSSAGPGLPWSDNFSGDTIGSVPTGWLVSGTSAGFTAESSDGPYHHVYAHSGWTATTVAGSASWTDYTLSVEVDPSAWASEDDSVAVRYTSGDRNDAVRFIGGDEIDLVQADGGTSTVLEKVIVHYSASWHALRITVVGSSITVSLDGETVMASSGATLGAGGIAFTANDPIAFADVSVTAA